VPVADASPRAHKGVARFGSSSAEVVLREPLRYAIVRHTPDGRRLLRARGDSILHRDEMTFVKIEGVEPDALTYRVAGSGPVRRLRAGTEIPGLPGLVFQDTVLLEHISYRYRCVDRVSHPDPVLLALDAPLATVEVEVARPAAPETATATARAGVRATVAAGGGAEEEGVLSRMQVEQLAPEEYVLHRGEFRVILDNAGQILRHLRPLVLPIVSMQGGLRFLIRSPATDGALGREGFSVASAKLTRRVGIETGDRIVGVNGRAVEGLRSLSQIYQELKRDAAVDRIDLELERDGRRLVNTYWLR
jgi:hypothetical protein